MVTVEVLNQIDHMILESRDDGLDLLRSGEVLDHLLQGAGAMLVERDLDHLRRRAVDQDGTLAIIAMLEELLAEIISKGV